jgi:MFS transporter, DHA1 family, inner membrane transport protein
MAANPSLSNSHLIVLTAGNFFVATSFLSVGGLLNEISVSLQIPIAKAGLLIAAFGISAAICAPVLATVGSRIDRRKLLTWSMAVCGIANVFAALSQSYDQLMIARVLGAVTSAVYTPQVAATVSMLVSEEERAPTLGKLMVGWAIGSVAGNPLSVLVGSQFGWRISFAAIGIASFVVAVFVWRAIPVGVRVPPLSLERWYRVFKAPALRWLTAATALTNIGSMVMLSFIAPIVKAVQGIEGSALAALFFVAGVGGLIGNVLSVRMVRRLGATAVAYKCNIVAGAMLLIWPVFAQWIIPIYIMQFMWSLGSAGFPAVQQARLIAIAPGLAAATIALNSSVTYLGGSVGASIGSTAWTLLQPRYLPWVGLIFIVGALACSYRGEKAARLHAATAG